MPLQGTSGGPVVQKKGQTTTVIRREPTPAPPTQPEPAGDGMLVALSAIHGLTASKVLKVPFWFQCAPLEQMPQDYTWEWEDFNTIGSGYHSNPTARGQSTYSLSSLFVDDDLRNSFTLVKNRHVLAMVKTLREVGDTLTPFQLQFGQPQLWGRWDVVVAVTMRGLHIEERAGETDARYFTVSMVEYADAPKLRAVPPITPAGSNAAAVQRGFRAILDTSKLTLALSSLSKIAKHYYGDPTGWRVIAKASGLTRATANEDLRVKYGHMHPPAKVYVPDLPKGK